jgi:hypothetical protein
MPIRDVEVALGGNIAIMLPSCFDAHVLDVEDQNLHGDQDQFFRKIADGL